MRGEIEFGELTKSLLDCIEVLVVKCRDNIGGHPGVREALHDMESRIRQEQENYQNQQVPNPFDKLYTGLGDYDPEKSDVVIEEATKGSMESIKKIQQSLLKYVGDRELPEQHELTKLI